MPAWVMEVSSHGIEQGRIAGIPFDATIWTTLGHDHLQDHGGFERYAALKAKFINRVMDNGGCVVVNAEQTAILERLHGSSWKGYMPKGKNLDVAFSGALHQADAMQWVMLGVGQVGLQWHGKSVVVNDVPVGQFHAENLAAVAQVLNYALHMDLPDIAACLQALPAPYGRMQSIPNQQGLQIYIDYAHTPEGLQACLQSARGLLKKDAEQGSLSLVFGCGGNRDVSKRAEMGAVAASDADKVWVTSDNPRDEDSEKIIDDIVQGMATSQNIHRCTDRGEAIAQALEHMQAHDVLIIAGKGHEGYMEIKGQRIPWHDATWVRQCLDAMPFQTEGTSCN